MIGGLERESEALAAPLLLPEHVLGESARARAHVGKEQRLTLLHYRQRSAWKYYHTVARDRILGRDFWFSTLIFPFYRNLFMEKLEDY
jgi:hypothetical protein